MPPYRPVWASPRGLVVVGDLIGSGEAQERGIVGETPNLAARLQGIAEPNRVVIAEGTRKLLGNLFEFEMAPRRAAICRLRFGLAPINLRPINTQISGRVVIASTHGGAAALTFELAAGRGDGSPHRLSAVV